MGFSINGTHYFDGNYFAKEERFKDKDGRTRTRVNVYAGSGGEPVAQIATATTLRHVIVQLLPAPPGLVSWCGDEKSGTAWADEPVVAFALCGDGEVRALLPSEWGTLEPAIDPNYLCFTTGIDIPPVGYRLTEVGKAKLVDDDATTPGGPGDR